MDCDVLCMMAHPDDAEILTGGTLIKMVDQGYAVGIIDFTRGEMGSRGTVEERMKECDCAAELMGVAVRENLGFPDAAIENTVAARERVVRAIRKYRPHLVITHGSPNRNPDHTHTSNLVRESCFTAGLVKYETGQPHHRPNKIMYVMENYVTRPDFLVDVSAQYERKRRAIACHRSQTFNPDHDGPSTYIASDRFSREVDARFASFGARIHVDYAEAFILDTPVAVENPVAEIALRGLMPGQGRS